VILPVSADYQMPEMNGIEFLKRFNTMQPDTIRLMLSGQPDSKVLIDSLDGIHIYRFISKPWHRGEFATTRAEALVYREQQRKIIA
jgi:response regulator RpfG family c-di-GMP phosphodiesterase